MVAINKEFALDERVRRWLRPAFVKTPQQNVWEWARDNVDFSLSPSYDSPIKTKYDPDYLPFWKEPVEAMTNSNVYEVTVAKCARAGGSENLLLNTLRYNVAVRPQPTLLVTGDQISAERFFEKRVKRGLRCSKTTKQKLNQARQTQHDIEFNDMDLRVTWPKAKLAFKQDGWACVLVDEASLMPAGTDDMARKRTASYPFAHVCFISSPDPQSTRPSIEDPIFINYNRGDQRKWRCKDPVTNTEFTFRIGTKDSVEGIKWSQDAKREDGTWDLDKVRNTAYYSTPDGTIIQEQDRMNIVRNGRWIATNPNAPSDCRSYHVTALMIPFDSLGGIAVAFLKANTLGLSALRTFIYEYMAEPWVEKKQEIEPLKLESRKGAYLQGQRASHLPAYSYLTKNKKITTIMTWDVQADRFPYVIREWYDGGDSSLIESGEAETWKDLAGLRAKYSTNREFYDLSYEARRSECLEQSIMGMVKGAIPMFGRDSLREAYKVEKRDPWEGTAKQGRKRIPMITFNPNQIKHIISRMIDGSDAHVWLIPSDISPRYIKEMSSEECVDLAWKNPHKRDNHQWDAEVMNLCGAMILGIFRIVGIDLDIETKDESNQTIVVTPAPVQVAPPASNSHHRPRKRGVYYAN